MEEAAAMKALGAAIAMAGGAIGGGIGLGMLFASWLASIARNPSAEGKLRLVGFISFAATELALLLSFVVAMLLLFAV